MLSTPSPHRTTALGIGALVFALGACATGPRVVQDRPTPSQKIQGGQVELDWHVEDTAGEEFTGYQIQVAGEAEFKTLQVDRVIPASPAKLRLPEGRWFWRVRGRYRTVGDRIRETPWSDVHFVGGRFVRRRVAFELTGSPAQDAPALDAPAAPAAPAATPVAKTRSKAPHGAKKVVRRRKKARRQSGPKVVPAHDNKPPLAGIRSISVAPVRTNGKPNDGLTREVVLRLFQAKRVVLLEGSFFREDQVVSIPPEVVETLAATGTQAAKGLTTKSIERENRFVLDPSQPTAMLPPGAVRLTRPDAVLVVRLYNLDVDPASLPKPPGEAKDRAGMIRFEEGIRALNATLVVMATGEISWTASLYSRLGVSDLTLVEDMVRRYFR